MSADAAVVLAPVISEKSFRLATNRQYRFVVARSATASIVAHAIEQLFSVHVQSVRTLSRLGKRTRHRGVAGQRIATKHALVTVKSGETIPGFEAAAELPTTSAASAKPAKPADQLVTKTAVRRSQSAPRRRRATVITNLPITKETQ